MIPTSEFFKEIARKDVRYITQTTLIGGVDVSRGMRSITLKHPYTAFIGGFSSKYVDLIISASELMSANIYDPITIKMGFRGAEEIEIGIFYLDPETISVDGVKGTMSFTAYDKAVIFDKQYTPVTLPATGKQIIEEIALRNGVEVDDEWEELTLDNFVFNQLNIGEGQNISDRQVINDYMICNLVLGMIKEDKLTYKNVIENKNITESYDGRIWTKLEYKDKEGPINQLVYGNRAEGADESYQEIVARDDESIVLNGLKEFKFYDNVFLDLLTEEQQQEIIDALFILINGLEYQPFNMSLFARPDQEVGDWVRVVDKDDNEAVAPVTSLDLTWKGGLRGVYECPVLPQTLTEYVMSGEEQTIKNALIRVNKAENKIEAAVSTVENIEGQVNEQATRLSLTDAKVNQEVLDRQTAVDGLRTETSSLVTQTKNEWSIEFTNLQQDLNLTDGKIEEFRTYYRYGPDGAIIGKSGQPMQFQIKNDRVSFLENGVEITYWEGKVMSVDRIIVAVSIILGHHQLEKHEGNLKSTVIRMVN